MEEMEEETVYELIEEHNEIVYEEETDLFLMVGENKTKIKKEIKEEYSHYLMKKGKKVFVLYSDDIENYTTFKSIKRIRLKRTVINCCMGRTIIILNDVEYFAIQDNTSMWNGKAMANFILHEKIKKE